MPEESYYDGITPVIFYKMILNDDIFYLEGNSISEDLVSVFKTPEGQFQGGYRG